jgi:hypothetical protein
MATVNKNFRIKHGLVVEGTTGTINGQSILTETGGDTYILNLVGGATLVKSVSSDFNVDGAGNLTIVANTFDSYGSASAAQTAAEGYTDTAINGLDTDDIEEGSTNLYHTAQRAKDAAADLLTNATKTNITITGTGAGLTITAENGVADSTTSDLAEGTNLYFTNQRALDATNAAYDAAGAAATAQSNAESYTDTEIGLLTTSDIEEGTNLYFTNQRALDATNAAYDAAGAAATAQSNAEDYADGLAVNYDPAGSASAAQTAAQSYADGLASNYDAAGAASTAETNANTYTDTALNDYTPTASLDTAIDGYGYLKSADLSGYATETYVGTAIDNLVDGAPGLLDTLNEIAAAINDDANYATTITTALSGKQGNLTASTGITIDGSNNISVTSNTYDAYGAASTAQSNAEDYADGLATNYDAAGTAAGLVDDLKDATTAFTAINLNSVSKQLAAQSTIATAQNGSSMMSWAKSDYGTAKAWVKFATATHSQVSEILLTTDSSNNIAITDFAEVGTNGSLGTITASYLSGNIAIEVNTVYANTTVTVVATLIK